MKISEKTQNIVAEVTKEGTKLGDLRKVAKDIKKDHQLAQGLWSTGKFFPMMLAILIFDPKCLDAGIVDSLLQDIDKQKGEERLQLTDWLMANQLMKDKKLTVLLPAWQNSSSPLKRRIFWYHQGRLRWMGQTPPDNTADLMDAMLVYSGSGLTPMVSEELMGKYMRGTKPEYDLSQKEADEIRSLLFSTIDKTEQDYYNRVFRTYTERRTQMGFLLASVEDGIAFNNYHEGCTWA